MEMTVYRVHVSEWHILYLRMCWRFHDVLLHIEEDEEIEVSSAGAVIVFFGDNFVGVRSAEMG